MIDYLQYLSNESPSFKSILLLLIVTAIWAIATPVIKFTLSGFDSLTFLTYRFFISSIVALAFSVFIGFRLPKDKKTLVLMFIYCILDPVVILFFFFWGMKITTVLDTVLISLTKPLIISIAGAIFLKERVTKRERIGILIASFGTIMTLIEPILQNWNNTTQLSGNMMILISVFISAGAAIMAKNLLKKGVRPLTMANLSFFIGFLSFLPFFILTRLSTFTSSFISTPPSYHFGVIYLALISGNLAHYLNNKARKSIEIGESAVFFYLSPLFSAPLAVVWLKEKITLIFILGAFIITAGVTIAEVKKSSK